MVNPVFHRDFFDFENLKSQFLNVLKQYIRDFLKPWKSPGWVHPCIFSYTCMAG